MKIFVTGGTGFLGRAVVDRCVARGHEVRVLVRDPRARPLPGAELVHASLDDPDRLRAAISGSSAVIHLAGKVSRDPRDAGEMHWLHVECTQRLVDAMRRAEVRRLVLASTSGTIAVTPSRREDATERDEASLEVVGRWPYYLSKRLEEQEVLRRDAKDEIEAVILNPSLLLGPGDDRLSSTTDVLDVLSRQVPAITDGTVAMVDVRDCADAFVHALEDGRRGHRYLLNGANMSVRTFVERVAHAGGVSPPHFRLPGRWALRGAKLMHGLYHAAGRTSPVEIASVDMSNHHWNCDSSKAKAELAFSPRDPEITIQDTVRYLDKKGLFRRAATTA